MIIYTKVWCTESNKDRTLSEFACRQFAGSSNAVGYGDDDDVITTRAFKEVNLKKRIKKMKR